MGAALALSVPYALLVVGGADPHVSLDDSFITLVYARNLAETGSWFYNAGDPAVDGFTSFLDVVVKAAAIRVWPGSSYPASVIVSRVYLVALLGTCVWAALQLSRAQGRRATWVCGGAALLFASSWDVAGGVASELESPLYVWLGVASVMWLPLRDGAGLARRVGWALCVTALPLARPEGLAIAALLLGTYAWLRFRSGGFGRALAMPAVCVLLLGGYYLWRIETFGFWAPNTYFAKTSASRLNEISDGVRFVSGYAQRSLFDAVKLLGLAAAPLWLLRRSEASTPERLRFALIAGVAWASVAIVIYSGGDSYLESKRLLMLPMTLALLLPFALLRDAAPRVRGIGIAALAIAGIAFVPWGLGRAAESARALRAGEPVLFKFPTDCARDLCQRLAALAPDGSLAHSDFQLVKFFAPDQRVIDLEGLNDRAIAHRPQHSPVLYGKFSQQLGIDTNAEIYVFGSRRWTATPMARLPLRRVLTETDLLWRYTGFGVSDEWPDQEKLTPAQIDALVDAYRPASMRGCDAWFNFLIRKDVARGTTRQGVMIGPSG